MSESHVRNMVIVGENSKAFIQDYSDRLLKDFIGLLKTAHGEKQVNANHFYQEYIANKDHIHMNATKWNSLSEFVKYLGRESICRVEDTEKGLHIAWIDNSPEALKRQEALRKKALQDQGDEELETRMIREQIRRAQAAQAAKRKEEQTEAKEKELSLPEGEALKISFGPKTTGKDSKAEVADKTSESLGTTKEGEAPESKDAAESSEKKEDTKPAGLGGFSMKMSSKPQAKNVFAQAKKSKPKAVMAEQPKKMSEAERIMKEEMERKRARESSGFGGPSAKKRKNF